MLAHLRVTIAPYSNTAPFEEMSQRCQAVGNTVPDLTGPRFEPANYRSRDERGTYRATGRLGSVGQAVTRWSLERYRSAIQIFGRLNQPQCFQRLATASR